MSEGYELIDPRPVAAAAPYTYYLPSLTRLGAICEGDLVQVTMRSVPPSDKWDAERMWVRVVSVAPEWLEGTLESEPSDMPQLVKGAVIRLPRSYVINIEFADPARELDLPAEFRREYWARCLVDQCVLDGVSAVQYLYREVPDMAQDGDKFPDSGWRIRGDMRDVSDEELSERKIAYVAIGAVLNKDDSWVHLIDEAIGSEFEKNFETGTYVRQES